ncbi:DsbA family protein [Avibacterium gallinarum]|uniref:DsbA family protein n=1 Tax=Avibacterium gallinarum TaxID=755 RepID=UPI003BF7FD15
MLEIMMFTDPMMGLSYESEPYLRQLETHFGRQIHFQPIMAGLVRSVYDFVDPQDLAIGKAYAIKQYLPKLMAIYNAEQNISGMPIAMTDLRLFSEEQPSSLPLNLAYKAVQAIAPEKAAPFLYRLRFATIAEQRPTTQLPELERVAKQCGIAPSDFRQSYHSPQTQTLLAQDFAEKERLHIHRLPAYVFRYQNQTACYQGVLTDREFFPIIAQISQGKIRPQPPALSKTALLALIDKHPLISPIELQYAFALPDTQALPPYLQQFFAQNIIRKINVPNGWFVEKVT